MIDLIPIIYTFFIGLCIGSFLNVVIYRIPEGISIVNPRSFCPECKKRIRNIENIPVVSWLLQKGKCSSCGININVRYPVIEILTGILFIVFSNSSPDVYNFNQISFIEDIFSWLLLSILIAISFIDIEHFWIPQSLLNVGFFSGFINLILIGIINQNIFSNYLLKGVLASIGTYLLFEILRLFAKKIYKRDALGKGDSKLASMLALWMGPIGMLLSFGLSYIVAAIYILIALSLKIIKRKDIIPFAPFLSIGALIVWFFGNQEILETINALAIKF